MESVFWACVCIASVVSLSIPKAKVVELWRHCYSWLRYGRAPIANKIVVKRISDIPLCANHTGIWFYLPVLSHTTNECALKQNLNLSRILIVSGSGAAGGYLCGPTPLALVGAFAGGVAGGLTYDCAVSIVLTHCSDDKIVLYGHCENLHVLFREDATQDEYVRQIMCLVFRILVDGFAGVMGFEAVRRIYLQLHPTAAKIDHLRLRASVTKEYKELERLMKRANKSDKKPIAEKIVALRRKVFDMYGDGDKGHQERIDNYARFLMKE
uniref:Uncharacterized protein n=1 Tax=Spumella elongata TaxID=89044 RepID=A0A7S3GVY6_9STRA|mmetsp:Transcript_221/g.393  ORF Transcript_221/g.393 Transcript_221/m.393 type:complete len:268 (+) Transcript_221:33-836(+)|eukprot:CAMPEP_0184994044 /NCGR_PEP_ID=MMETSP1098-20130426/47782_1 /TAXON_ID=89044 /ORGANISM="Spumella elongata, Strain CCAP 955/1" /LENGTH=267 /DNA_ID=CAMNT_0027520027 /DNA_START=14 /DNA_END=817 /DNA_ORIENTATION=+